MPFDLGSFAGTSVLELLDHWYPSPTPKKPSMKAVAEKEDDFVVVETALRDLGAERPTFQDKSDVKYPDLDSKTSTCHYAAGRYYNAGGGRLGDFSGYLPNLKRITDATIPQLPHFLFRVTHDKSGGQNREGQYLSQAVKVGLGEADFFTFSNLEVKESLHNHEVNKKCSSHWISLTDSGLAAVAYALQLHEQSNINVQIHMVDTTKLRNRPLIVYAYPMLKGYRVCWNRKSGFQKMILGASYTEFLVWDELDIEACCVNITVLIGAGLNDLPIKLKASLQRLGADGRKRRCQPASKIRKHHIKLGDAKTIEKMREEYYSGPWNRWKRREWVAAYWGNPRPTTPITIRQRPDNRSPMSTDVMNRYRTVAETCKKPEFQLVMLIALLSMSTPMFYHDSMVDELMNIPQDHVMFEGMQCFTTGLETPAKPEVRAFQAIFADFMKRREGRDAVINISESIRVIIRLDEGQNNFDEKPLVKQTHNGVAVNYQPPNADLCTFFGYQGGESGVSTPSAEEEERPAKGSKTSEERSNSILTSPPLSQAATPVSRSSPSPRHSVQAAPPNGVHAEDAGATENQTVPSKIIEPKENTNEKEMGTDTVWAIACLTSALGAQNDRKFLIELSANDFNEAEAAETIKGLYHLVD